jgi:hypothetical protein
MKRGAPANPNDALSDDFRDFISALNSARVEFVLIGGYAVGAYGVVRATVDIDFLYRRTAGNVRQLCNALRAFGAPANIVDPVVLMTPAIVAMLGAPPQRIDLLSEIDGVDFETVWSGSTVIELKAGLPVRLIGLAELRRNKAATGRPKDLADLRQLPAPGASDGPTADSEDAHSVKRPKRGRPAH